MKIKNIIILLLLIIFMVSCALNGTDQIANKEAKNVESNDVESVGDSELVASIDLGEQGYVKYYSVDSETLITEAMLKNLQDYQSYCELDTEEFYKLMTGQEAPQKLTELIRNINVNSEMHSDEDEDLELSEPQIVSNNANGNINYSVNYVGILSEDEFKDRYVYIGSGHDHVVWCSRTGTGYITRKTKKMASIVHCYMGSVTNRIEYKKGLKNKSVAENVPAGYTSVLSVESTIKKNKTGKIHNADGDAYHAWIWWRT